MAVVQYNHAAGNGSAVVALTGVTSGNSLVFVYAQNAAQVRAYTAADNVAGSFGSAIVSSTANSRCVGGFALHGVAAGSHTSTLTADAGTTTVEAWLFEVSDLDSGASPIFDTFLDTVDTDDHLSATAGNIDTSGACFVITAGALSGTVSSQVAGATYTAATTNNTQRLCQYKVAATALTDDRGAWSSTGTDRTGTSMMIAFPESGGGGAFEIETVAGSYATTGSNASLLHHRVLTADAGSYAVTGSAAELLRGRVLVTEAGAYLLTGSAADMTRGYALTAEPGSYAVTGSPTDLLRTYVLDLEPGSYSVLGSPADLVRTGAASLTADPGVYAITGATADLLRGYVLACEPGAYTVTGSDAALARTRSLVAEPGSYALTGFSASLVGPAVVPPYVLREIITRRVRRAPHLSDEDRWLFYRMLQVDLEAGLGLSSGQGSDPQVMLRWSDDDAETWSDEQWTSAGAQGQYARRALWRRLGRSRDRIFEVVVSDPIAWRLLQAILTAEQGTR